MIFEVRKRAYFLFFWQAILATLVLGGCASAPQREQVIVSEQALTRVANKRHRQIEQFVNSDALSATPRIALPTVRIAEGAHSEAVSLQEATLVANHAARSVCLRLAPYAELQTNPVDGIFAVSLVLTAINPSSGAAAGASFVVSYFVPGPSRLPIGLGGMAIEAELRDQAAGQLALMRWSRGANSASQDAKVSRIGDAWQLAEDFGKDFSRLLLDTDAKKWGMQRKRLDKAVVRANRTLCAQRFGKLNTAGRGASMLLPLGPAAMDPGPPEKSD